MAAGLHKSQVLLLALTAFILGVFVASVVTIPLWGILLVLLVAVSVAMVSSYERTYGPGKKGERRRYMGFLISSMVVVFTIGIWRFDSFSAEHGLLLELADRTGVAVTVKGYIDGDFVASPAAGRFPFRVTHITAGDKLIEINERVLVQTERLPEYRYGQFLVLEGEIQTPQNFDKFDYVSYLKKDGIRLVMKYPEVFEDEEGGPPDYFERAKLGLFRRIFAVRDAFQRSVNLSVPEPMASYLNGILLGARQNIPADMKESFSRTGTSHILAISGYNIAVIVQAVLYLMVFFLRRRKAFWLTAAIIMVFTVMTGASASVVRAAVMGLLVLFASSYGRLSEATNGILLAGGIMTWANPMVLRFDIGFQLSFLAVAGLLYIQPLLEHVFRKVPKGVIKETILASLAAQIAVIPLLAYYFGSVSIAALPVNLLVLPFVPVVMILGFVMGVAGMIFIPLGQLVGIFAWAAATYQLEVIQWFAGLSFASVSVSFGWPMLVGSYIMLLALLIKARRVLISDVRNFPGGKDD